MWARSSSKHQQSNPQVQRHNSMSFYCVHISSAPAAKLTETVKSLSKCPVSDWLQLYWILMLYSLGMCFLKESSDIFTFTYKDQQCTTSVRNVSWWWNVHQVLSLVPSTSKNKTIHLSSKKWVLGHTSHPQDLKTKTSQHWWPWGI